MSVKELVLKREWEFEGSKRVNKFCVNFTRSSELFHIKITNGKIRETGKKIECNFALDRSQAHLLMLYLQEHLNEAR